MAGLKFGSVGLADSRGRRVNLVQILVQTLLPLEAGQVSGGVLVFSDAVLRDGTGAHLATILPISLHNGRGPMMKGSQTGVSSQVS